MSYAIVDVFARSSSYLFRSVPLNELEWKVIPGWEPMQFAEYSFDDVAFTLTIMGEGNFKNVQVAKSSICDVTFRHGALQ